MSATPQAVRPLACLRRSLCAGGLGLREPGAAAFGVGAASLLLAPGQAFPVVALSLAGQAEPQADAGAERGDGSTLERGVARGRSDPLVAALERIVDPPEKSFVTQRKDAVEGGGYARLIVEFDGGAEIVFHGIGSASELPAITGMRFPEGIREGVGQVVVHADNMLQGFEIFSSGEPGPADYPRAPYPPRAQELHVSLAESGIFDTLVRLRTIGARELPGGTGGLNEVGQGWRRGSVGQCGGGRHGDGFEL